MRKKFQAKLEAYRVTHGALASPPGYGPNGMFEIPGPDRRAILRVVASEGVPEVQGYDFEHVSVSLPVRCPTWEEMDFIKRLFWDDQECVMQLHVPRSRHVNEHQYCLHLWRPLNAEIPMPAIGTVGPTSALKG